VARKPSKAARIRTHSGATTTPRIRRAIRESEEKNIVLAKRYGVNRKTIAKWKARDFGFDQRMGPKNPRSSLLSHKDEVIILAYRWRTRLALNDCHLSLRGLMPKLSRSTLYRCLKRRGLSRIGPTATCPPLTTAALRGPYIFEITVHDVVFRIMNTT
jgi:transposase